ncbi:transposase family protein [Myxococcus sp. CA040A]|nr:transposase family protein [Myxococcus sp. CA040A]NTX11099.1 transposase family protein [Myxococcus sp. CA056]NTX34811.1 transposase family protein [Myxococcus sp. CA033]NTX51901.1 transposase family protein [Myxococcus sp. CA039A]
MRRRAGRLWHRTDQGSTYASEDYQHVLARHGIVRGISRCGNCYDNAALESGFSTLKPGVDNAR